MKTLRLIEYLQITISSKERNILENKLIELLKIELTEIHQGFKKASLEGKGTPQEIADRREEVIHAFFEKYFPFPFRVTKGNIIDSFGLNSSSIDCVILDPSHPYTIDSTNKRPSVILADGVDYAIEVKGSLASKVEIDRVLKQITSVKELTRINCGVFIDDLRTPYHYKIPCIIYVEETFKDIKLLLNYIVDYYQANGIKRLKQFDILVTNSSVIMNSHPDTINLSNRQGLLYVESKEYTLGVMLFWMTLIPLVQPQFNDDVIKHYLKFDDIRAQHLREYDEILRSLEQQ